MINIITRRATLWTDQCLKSDFNKKFPHVSTFHCMWFPLFSCQPRNSSHAITATLKVLIKFYFSVTDDDFLIRDSFLIVMMLNAHKMLWLTPWNEEVDAWLPQLCYKSAWLSCFGGFFFLWSQPVFSLCQCWWNTAHRNLTLPYWTIVRRTSKHILKISKTYLYVTSMSPRATQHLLHLWSIWWEFGFFSSCWELDEKVGITVMSEQTGNERKWVTHRRRHLLMSFSSFYMWLTHLDWIILLCDSNNGHTLQINFPFYSHWLETIGWGHRAEREPRAVFL